LVISRGGSAETVKKRFGNPNSLSQRLLEIEPRLTVEGRDGIDAQGIKLAAIERIAHELQPDAKEQPGTLFQKEL
jgi:hypothetical protein